mmetsp:Transcript_48294/g.137938  ORF Transcript_48294/g.137938 Transcript_48294/m.137938 type:complete len:324 (-) Transcript_48294:199-1170(-)
MEGSRNAGGEGLEWFYLDSTGQEFGPFSGETMREWFSQGFFPIGEELLVRLPAWKNHTPLRTVYPEVSEAFLGPPRGVQSGPVQPPAQDSYSVPYGGSPQWPYGADGRGSQAGRQLVEEGPPYVSPQQFSGYWMMPPVGPGSYAATPGAGCAGYPPAGYPPMGGMRPGYGAPAARHPGTYGMYSGPPQQGSGSATGRFQGRIKSFNAKQGFGFIESPEAHALFGRDVFLHKAQIGDLKVGTEVTYCVEMNKQGMPQARELATLDGQPPGPSPLAGVKGGGGGGGGGGGKGKGGGNAGMGGGGPRNKRRTGGKGGLDEPSMGQG